MPYRLLQDQDGEYTGMVGKVELAGMSPDELERILRNGEYVASVSGLTHEQALFVEQVKAELQGRAHSA